MEIELPNKPWQWHENGDANEFRLMANGNWLINFGLNGELMPAKQQAIAQHIVTCVNRNDEMLDALNQIARLLYEAPGVDQGNSKVHDAFQMARNTILQITEKESNEDGSHAG